MRHRGVARAGLVLALVATVACVAVDGEFACTEDAACVRGGEAGRCARGHCMFADSACDESGYRFDEHSGNLGGRCAECGEGVDSVCPEGDRPDRPIALDPDGAVPASFRYAHDDTETSCGAGGQADVFLQLALPAPAVLYVDHPFAGSSVAIAVRAGACADVAADGADLFCERSNCMQGTTQIIGSIPASDYCIIVEGGADTVIRHIVRPHAEILAPTDEPTPVQGDTCAPGSSEHLHHGGCTPRAGANAPERLYAVAACEPRALAADLGYVLGFDAIAYVRGEGDLVPEACKTIATDADDEHTWARRTPPPIFVPMSPPNVYWLVVDNQAPPGCGKYVMTYATPQ